MFQSRGWRDPRLFRASAAATLVVGVLVAALWLGAVGLALADQDADANRLVVEAVKLVEWAEGIEAPAERAAVFKEALAKLDAIVERHPESELAVRLVSGQAIGEIERVEIEKAWQRALTEHCLAEPTRACLGERADAANEALKQSDDRDEVLALIVGGYAELGAYDEALTLAGRVVDGEKRGQAMGGVARTQAQAGDIETALETASMIGHARKRAGTFAHIALSQAMQEQFDQALGTAEAIELPSYRAMAVASIALVGHVTGEQGGSEKQLLSALETAATIEHVMVRAAAYGIIAAIEAKVGQSTRAHDALTAMEDAFARALGLQSMEAFEDMSVEKVKDLSSFLTWQDPDFDW